MKKIKFKELQASDIECRVGTARGDYATLLLYKDARVDQRVLDDTFGCFNWQREHYELKGNMYCRVGINANYDNEEKDPVWVWKSDCGAESNTEKEKGEASDSFKRACFNWGIGRELYSSPQIIVRVSESDKRSGKLSQKFIVKEIEYENGEIKSVVIVDKDGNVRFSNKNRMNITQNRPEQTKKDEEQGVEYYLQYYRMAKTKEEINQVYMNNKSLQGIPAFVQAAKLHGKNLGLVK